MDVQVVCGLFYCEGSFETALDELHWSIGQNPEFWRTAVLFVDTRAEAFLTKKCKQGFKDVIVDRDIPESILKNPGWGFKGWWAQKATVLFGRILLCDFDILVRKMPDEALFRQLKTSPMFTDYPGYSNSTKVVGCGITYYDTECEWDVFMDLLLNKWSCDERAWTEALKLDRSRFLAEGWHMNPYIVNHDWLLQNPSERYNAYIIHGISPVAFCKTWLGCLGGAGFDSRQELKRIGFRDEEVHFNATLKEETIYRCSRWMRRLRGRG